MADFIIDCSVTMAWCFADETTPETTALLRRLDNEEAVVPGIWVVEVSNTLIVGERRGRITQSESARFVELLQSLPIITFVEDEMNAFQRVMPLARSLKLSAYDALYLDLALRSGLPLATLDTDLIAAAKKTGATLL